jgi:HNH endonuclease
VGASNFGKSWSREETVLAYRLYCELPFGQLDHRTQKVIALAQALGRTPNALALKLSNLAHLDPALQARGIRGMGNVSALDRETAATFAQDWDAMIDETSDQWASIFPESDSPSPEEPLPSDVPTDALAIVRIRLKQAFFRRTVIASYELCCVCLVSRPKLLVASHIKPWAISTASERVSPTNGLAMCALHDRAFDRGLLTVTPEFVVRIGAELRDIKAPSPVERAAFEETDGQKIRLPSRFLPDVGLLTFHNERVFTG